MRIFAMDVGDRRIGLAVSDELGWTAQGIGKLERKDSKSDLERLKEIISQYKPKEIVLGLPKNMNGSIGPQGEKVKNFGESLMKIFNGDIVYWDERLTTVSAQRVLIDADISRKKRKQKVDQIAAVLILQGYLDFINNKKKESE